jgi:hypothetical protein
VLSVAGVPVTEAVAQYGSPLFLLDEQHFRVAARTYADAYAGADVYYAAKAFLTTRIARWAVEEGLRIDVCTLGEMEVALRAGVPGEQLLFHGNNKSMVELRRALEVGSRAHRGRFLRRDRTTCRPGRGARRAPQGAGAGDCRGRGPHPRVHRHGPRGPEVRTGLGRRGGGGRGQGRHMPSRRWN